MDKFSALARAFFRLLKAHHHLNSVCDSGRVAPGIYKIRAWLGGSILPAGPTPGTRVGLKESAEQWLHRTLTILEGHYVAQIEGVCGAIEGIGMERWEEAWRVGLTWVGKRYNIKEKAVQGAMGDVEIIMGKFGGVGGWKGDQEWVRDTRGRRRVRGRVGDGLGLRRGAGFRGGRGGEGGEWGWRSGRGFGGGREGRGERGSGIGWDRGVGGGSGWGRGARGERGWGEGRGRVFGTERGRGGGWDRGVRGRGVGYGRREEERMVGRGERGWRYGRRGGYSGGGDGWGRRVGGGVSRGDGGWRGTGYGGGRGQEGGVGRVGTARREGVGGGEWWKMRGMRIGPIRRGRGWGVGEGGAGRVGTLMGVGTARREGMGGEEWWKTGEIRMGPIRGGRERGGGEGGAERAGTSMGVGVVRREGVGVGRGEGWKSGGMRLGPMRGGRGWGGGEGRGREGIQERGTSPIRWGNGEGEEGGVPTARGAGRVGGLGEGIDRGELQQREGFGLEERGEQRERRSTTEGMEVEGEEENAEDWMDEETLLRMMDSCGWDDDEDDGGDDDKDKEEEREGGDDGGGDDDDDDDDEEEEEEGGGGERRERGRMATGKSRGVEVREQEEEDVGEGTSEVRHYRRHDHRGNKGRTWELRPSRPVIILGDSNLHKLPRNNLECVQIDCYPGAKFSHITHILRYNTPTSGDVDRVILSVGINERSGGKEAVRGREFGEMVKAAKDTFPDAAVHIPVVNFDPKLQGEVRRNLLGINKLIEKTEGYIPPLAQERFRTEGDRVHWTRETGEAMWEHWMSFLEYQQGTGRRS